MTGNRIGVELYADVSQYNSAMKKAQSEADSIEQKLGSEVVDAANRAERALNSISGNVTAKINVDDSEISEIDTAKRNLDDLDTTVTPKIDVDDSGAKELETIKGDLDELKAMGAINIALTVGGNAIGLVQSLGRFSGLGAVMEMDNALAQIEGRTGRMIPQAEMLITDLYTNGWGESRAEIAEVIIAASNLGIANEDLGAAAQQAFFVASASGEETTEVLRAMDTMVKNGLAPDFKTASDIITTGLQTGANRGEDLLDTFNEYGSTFQTLGISAEGALGFINSGLKAGVDNSDRIADSLRETGIRLREMNTDENIAAAFAQLDELSSVDLAASFDAFNAGEITGDEFYGGFFSALAEANKADPQAAANIATVLVGTISEDFGPEVISQLTPQWDDAMGKLEGRAETAGNAVSMTLGAQFETLFRGIEQEAVNFLSSEQIDLPGKMEAIKTAIADTLGALSSGATLGEALEIGLNMPGFNDAVLRFESGVGNFLIAALELIAGVQDFAGKDSTGTRAEITRLAEGQLAFDLKVANPDEIDNVVATALGRGVSGEALAANIVTAIDESLAAGDVATAQALAEHFNEIPAAIVRTTSTAFADMNQVIPVSFNPEIESEAEFQARLQAQVDEIQRTVGGVNASVEFLDIDTSGIEAATVAVETEAAAMRTAFDEALAIGDIDTAGALATQLGDEDLLAQVETLREVMGEVDSEVTTASQNISTQVQDMGAIVGEVLTGNTVTEDFRAVAVAAMTALPMASLAIMSFGLTTPLYLEPAKQALMALRSIVAGLGDLVGNVFGSMNANLQQSATLATAAKATIEGAAAAATASAGAGTASPNAQGGPFGAGDPLLFEGSAPEIITFNQPGSVIGIRDTRSILDAVTALASGTLGAPVTNQTSTRNISVVNNNVVQSLPQAELVAQRTATAIRGF